MATTNNTKHLWWRIFLLGITSLSWSPLCFGSSNSNKHWSLPMTTAAAAAAAAVAYDRDAPVFFDHCCGLERASLPFEIFSKGSNKLSRSKSSDLALPHLFVVDRVRLLIACTNYNIEVLVKKIVHFSRKLLIAFNFASGLTCPCSTKRN